MEERTHAHTDPQHRQALELDQPEEHGAQTTRTIAGTSIAVLRPTRSDHAPPPIMPTNWNSDANVTAMMTSPRWKSKYVVAYAMTKTVYT